METETANFFVSGTWNEVTLQSLGQAILTEHLKTAAMVLVHATTPVFKKKEQRRYIRQSMAFVQGTGIETIVEAYHLDVDPEQLRETFFSWVEYKRRRLHSALSSATTQAS